MKAILARAVVGAAVFCLANPAFADLIKVTGAQATGTGLGAVMTAVTVKDNTNNANRVVTESGCVTYKPSDVTRPFETCAAEMGLEGGDNTAGNAGNNTYFLSSIAGLANAGQLGFVVHVSEPGNGSATLTHLYMSLFRTDTSQLKLFAYTGADLIMADSGGTGQSGIQRFILDDLQAAEALGFCPVLSQCVVGGGVQFAAGSTQGDHESVYVGAFQRPPAELPEPFSLALVGVGLAGMSVLRRRAKQAAG